MRLNAPKKTVFWISVVLAGLGIIGSLVIIIHGLVISRRERKA